MEYKNALRAVEDIKWNISNCQSGLDTAWKKLDALLHYINQQETVPDIKAQGKVPVSYSYGMTQKEKLNCDCVIEEEHCRDYPLCQEPNGIG